MTMIKRPKLLRRREVAEVLAMSERNVLRLTQLGVLPSPVHVGRCARWSEDEILDWLRQLASQPRRPRKPLAEPALASRQRRNA
jgi:predicted DNA-binding transcriptional regulator AlpA